MYFYPKLNKSKNKQQKALLLASKSGYRVISNGIVCNSYGNQLSLHESSKGYLKFNIRLNNNSIKRSKQVTPVKVHRLQAFQKYGYKILNKGIQVRHLNGDKKDNSYENIAIGTQSENMMDIPKKVRKRIAGNANRKTSKKEYKEIRERVKNGNYETYQRLAEEYGLKSKSSIHYIVNK